MATYVIEVTVFKSEVRFDLQGCLEVAGASESAKRVPTIYTVSNMHMDM